MKYVFQRLHKGKILGGHRPKNGPKIPHFRVKIGKMHHFCLTLEILGGGTGPPGPPSYASAATRKSFKKTLRYVMSASAQGSNFRGGQDPEKSLKTLIFQPGRGQKYYNCMILKNSGGARAPPAPPLMQTLRWNRNFSALND